MLFVGYLVVRFSLQEEKENNDLHEELSTYKNIG